MLPLKSLFDVNLAVSACKLVISEAAVASPFLIREKLSLNP